MPDPRPWTPLETEELQDCVVFRVSRRLARHPRTGEAHPFFRIDASDWVNVVPITPEGQLVMIRQYRHGSGEVTLEVPGGIVDPGESPSQAATRELLEETGYRAGALTPIGRANPNPALFGNRVHSFLARDARRVAPIRNDGNEETAVELVSRDTLRQRLREGAIDHALVLVALYWFEMTGEGSGVG
ncbi:MAG: NUDIX hydrolase [Deltaproteobacteria bacterium]|nr:MAG: NUDIX hydrolase [Deltaproteobacteria bacterium]